MAIRTDIYSIDWTTSPRRIWIDISVTEANAKDLYDTCMYLESLPSAIDEPHIINASGLEDLGGGQKVGLTVNLVYAQYAFVARPGPEWVICNMAGGNVVATEYDLVTPLYPRYPTAFVSADRTSSASATLQELSAIQFSSFNGGVTIDVINGTSGTDYPTGTPRQPSNNLTDTKQIAVARGFSLLFVKGNLAIGATDVISGYTLVGEGASLNTSKTTITMDEGCVTANTNFEHAKIQGVQNGEVIFRNCTIGNITNSHCTFENCSMVGPVSMVNSSWTQNHVTDVVNCYTSYSWYELDYNSSPINQVYSNFTGRMKVLNCTDNRADIYIRLNAGIIWLDSTCTDCNKIVITGTGKFINDSSIDPSKIDTLGLVSKEAVVDAIQDEIGGEIEYSSFEGGVSIDAVSGSDSNIGSRQYPVQTTARAVEVLTEKGFKKVYVDSTMTFNSNANFDSCVILGYNKLTKILTIDPDANVSNCIYKNLTVTGTLDNESMLEDCIVTDIDYIEGDIHRCEIIGTLVIKGTSGLEVYDSYSGRQGTADPAIIDMDSSAKNVAIHNWSGHMKIKNMTAGVLGISCSGGAHIKLESTCTGGMIHLMGNFKLIDQSAGSVVKTEYQLTPASIANKVLNSIITGTTTTQQVLTNLHDAMPRMLGLMMENHVEDDIVRDINGNKTSSKFYLYDSKANALAHDKATGLIATYSVAITYTVDEDVELFSVVKD